MMSKNTNTKTYEALNQIGFYALDDLVLEDNLLRKIDRHIDFNFIYELAENTYCHDKELENYANLLSK